MAIMKIQMPDGSRKLVEVPDGVDIEEVLKGDTSALLETPEAPTKLTPDKGIQGISKRLKELGYSDSARAAILGNIDIETGGSFDPQTKQIGGKGRGIFQFDFMKPVYDQWRGEEKDTTNNQIAFMHSAIFGGNEKNGVSPREMLGAGNAKTLGELLKSDASVDEKALGFSRIFERPGKPHEDRRVKSARKFLSTFAKTETPKKEAQGGPTEALK